MKIIRPGRNDLKASVASATETFANFREQAIDPALRQPLPEPPGDSIPVRKYQASLVEPRSLCIARKWERLLVPMKPIDPPLIGVLDQLGEAGSLGTLKPQTLHLAKNLPGVVKDPNVGS